MIKKLFTSKPAFILSSILFLLFMVLVLPYFSTLTNSKTNSDFSPDTGFFYTAEEFYENMEIYQQEGRDFYILMRWTFDLIWPLVYTFFFLQVLYRLSKSCNKKKRKIVMILPFLGYGFDLMENTFASINVGIYPKESQFLFSLMQISSMLKWLFIFIIPVLIVYLLITNRKKRTQTN
jgi:hypothetical protein